MLGKVKIFAKKLLKRQITFIGGLGTGRGNRLLQKEMKYSAIADLHVARFDFSLLFKF